MGNPVICARSASLRNGQLMIKDMWPNRSLANPVVDPAPQGPRYVRVVENTLPVVNAADAVARDVSGLAAYLLVTVDAGAASANFTAGEAKTAADAIIADMRAGGDMEAGTLAGHLAAVVAGSGLDGTGDSTATLENILAILGGAHFVVPAGTSVDAEWQDAATQTSWFDATKYAPVNADDSSFWISLAQGDLKGAVAAGLVMVYDSEGNPL